jgi:CRP-like cAMP-binding protein
MGASAAGSPRRPEPVRHRTDTGHDGQLRCIDPSERSGPDLPGYPERVDASALVRTTGWSAEGRPYLSTTTPSRPSENAILGALPRDERVRLDRLLEPVEITAAQLIYESGEPVRYVYFPTGALFSILSTTDGARSVEVSALGLEGFVGLPVVLEDDAPVFRVIGQVAGSAWRMRAEDLRAELARGGPLRRLLLRFAQAQMTQAGQSAACNRLHEIDQRTARWLLHSADWTGQERFELTQQFLAYMLGVRRPSVTTAAALMQRAGFITYRRGTITIVDRVGLEGAACECYALIRDEYRRLVG